MKQQNDVKTFESAKFTIVEPANNLGQSAILFRWPTLLDLKTPQKHNNSTRVIYYSSMRFTPTSFLEILLMLLPLNIAIEWKARQTIYRPKCSGRLGYAIIGHSKIIEEMSFLSCLLKRTGLFQPKFSIEFPARNDWFDQEISIMPPRRIVIYTEDSFCDGRADAGVY
jgi:hypothetical protein